MHTTSRALLGAAVLGVALGTAAPAQAIDAPYPDRSVEVTRGGSSAPASQVQNAGRSTGAGQVSSPATLPFTGGEVALLAALGGAAVASGGALLVAGRRRTTS